MFYSRILFTAPGTSNYNTELNKYGLTNDYKNYSFNKKTNTALLYQLLKNLVYNVFKQHKRTSQIF